jgi:hypothetical protein
LIGKTQIVNQEGKIQKELDISDGDGILVDKVAITIERKTKETPIGFWTAELPPQYLESWVRENSNGQDYYMRNRLRMIGNLAI